MVFRGESWLFDVRFLLRISYDPSTVCSPRLVRTVHDVCDDSSTINGDASTVIQDVTTIVVVLPLPTFCVYTVSLYDLVVYPSRLESYGIVRSRDCS